MAILEHGLPLSDPLVLATVADLKTMTRRVVKPQPIRVNDAFDGTWDWKGHLYDDLTLALTMRENSPYGPVGSLLYLRHTWRIESFMEGEPMRYGYKALPGVSFEEPSWACDVANYEEWDERIRNQSSDDAQRSDIAPDGNGVYHWDEGQSPCHWRSGRFMPKWAAANWVQITGLRAERVQDISEEDAIAEGSQMPVAYLPKSCQQAAWSERQQFSRLWDSLNAKRGHGWDVNDWVRVISYQLVSKTGREAALLAVAF